MGLSRKSQRELKKLRGRAEDLWSEQREVLEHASAVLREASRQTGEITKRDVAPKVRDTYSKRVQPGIDAGVGTVKSAATHTRDVVQHSIVPAVSGAIGSALAVIDVARDQSRTAIRDASQASRDLATKAGQRVGLIEVKPTPGPGRYILIGLGVVAALGVAYAAYQVLRADDDLWVEDEPVDSLPPKGPPVV